MRSAKKPAHLQLRRAVAFARKQVQLVLVDRAAAEGNQQERAWEQFIKVIAERDKAPQRLGIDLATRSHLEQDKRRSGAKEPFAALHDLRLMPLDVELDEVYFGPVVPCGQLVQGR